MSHEIKNHLEAYIRQEQALLDQLFRLKRERKDVKAEIGRTIISEGVAAIAKDLFESSLVGRLGRKATKTALDQKHKEQFLIQERNIDSRHSSLVQSAGSFLSSISVKRKNLKEPNSPKLVAKLDRVQEFVKLETRIRRTITALKSIVNKPLISNKDIRTRYVAQETMVLPGKPFTGSMRIKEILQGIQGYAKIIDPYVDGVTLEFLLGIPKGLPVKLLTAHTGGKDKERRFQRACRRLKVERPQFEVRKCQPKLIHDRFILTRTQGWSIGSSLKDIGKKLSVITEMSTQTKHEVEDTFDKIWIKSINLIT